MCIVYVYALSKVVRHYDFQLYPVCLGFLGGENFAKLLLLILAFVDVST